MNRTPALKRVSRGFLAAALLATLPFSAHPQTLDKSLEAALKSIRPMDVYDFTKTLASPEYRGRLTGDEGYTAAAKWAGGWFAAWKLKPLGSKEGFLQPYPSPYTVVDTAEMTLFLPQPSSSPAQEPAYSEKSLVPEKEFLPLLFSDSGDRTAGTVFAGWGISAPGLGYDDYAGLDVHDKFVFCFRGTPERGSKFQVYDEHRTRMKTARDKGALGIIYIYADIAANPNGDWLPGFTPAMISEGVMDLILKETGTATAELRKSLATYKRPISFPLHTRVRLAVASRHFQQGVGYNVVGFVEGSDPALRKEVVVVGGHFDHCGRHMGLLFPGADDNASGSAVVMAAARAFAQLEPKPRRSVAFVLFGGEEMGLQGSTWFVKHRPRAFSEFDAVFNFDMEGEGDGMWGGVSAEPTALRAAVERADRSVGILRGLRTMGPVGVRGSDYAPFVLAGIPAVSLGSNGPHLAYHQTGDTIYRINPEIMADAARLAFLAAYFWADR
jgi:hypothetical protein